MEGLLKIKLDADGFDPLKLPLNIVFDNEAGIDMGGVSKEYFKLLIEELFDPNLGMF